MYLFDLREPINSVSHGAGMMLAIPITWILWRRCDAVDPCEVSSRSCAMSSTLSAPPVCRRRAVWDQRLKGLSLLVFGITLIFCYSASTTFHAVWLQDEPRSHLRRLDHIGIYLLIAGTYTPVAWSLMRGPWRWGTLATVWTITALLVARVWHDGVLPIWMSTLTYLSMGWGALVCYRELARTCSHRRLFPLLLGGILYTVGAALNLAKWPVLYPGVFAAHELFHLFVIAGSACHIFFMFNVVIPAPSPMPVPVRSRPWPALPSRWAWPGRTWVRAELVPVCVEPPASRLKS